MKNVLKTRLQVEQLENRWLLSDVPLMSPVLLPPPPEEVPALVQEPVEVATDFRPLTVWDASDEELETLTVRYEPAKARTYEDGSRYFVWNYRLPDGHSKIQNVEVVPPLDPDNPYIQGLDWTGWWRPRRVHLELPAAGGYLVRLTFRDGSQEVHAVGAGMKDGGLLSETIYEKDIANPRHRKLQVNTTADVYIVGRVAVLEANNRFLLRSVDALQNAGVPAGSIHRASTVGKAIDIINAAFLAKGAPVSVVMVGYGSNGYFDFGQGLLGPYDVTQHLVGGEGNVTNFTTILAGKVESLELMASSAGRALNGTFPSPLVQQLATGLNTTVFSYLGPLGVSAVSNRRIEEFYGLTGSGLLATNP